MIEYDHEPVRGLPGDLPAGEEILWQGAPDWRVFLRSALKSRWIIGYFVAIALVALASGSFGGALASAISGVLAVGLLAVYAVLVARTTVYTITNRRVVLRIGVALNKCINLPLKLIGAAHLRPQGGEFGDIALELLGRHGLGYAMIWPHARPLKLRSAQPMMRGLPDAQNVAGLLTKACAAVVANAPVNDAPKQAGAAVLPGRFEEAIA
ncbi:photosynthetic complex putative assembly protein PuhB [Aurantiacibacter marinus]|uniref:Photosynthetic complex assembly protein n=1 Tax=Aurantiacibacter marinus TaxID=874156 RepID=A0A0H0XJU7_9SPHN|nr:photosynthetic complex putative assembly protein PuhB [Aurantiacibacter marinus]KLI62843.1 photosynthetic complex assembly protein [Aurantiacibacter marinus]